MIVFIVRQPFAVMAVDSSQVRTFDFADVTKTAWRADAEKIHSTDGIVAGEGGNHQVFAAFHRRLTSREEAQGGIEAALKKAPTLMSRAARAWEMETKYKWPKLDKGILSDARSTYTVIAGWSDRKRKILAGTVGDDPAFNSLSPENGFLLQCAGLTTRRSIESYLKSVLFPIQKTQLDEKSAMEVCRKCIVDAAALEEKRTGTKRLGGHIRFAIMRENQPPKIIVSENPV